MLIQYCISIGKSNIRAIETIGLRWSDAGVFSIEEAENKIKQAHRASQSFTVVASAFGLKIRVLLLKSRLNTPICG